MFSSTAAGNNPPRDDDADSAFKSITSFPSSFFPASVSNEVEKAFYLNFILSHNDRFTAFIYVAVSFNLNGQPEIE